MIKAQAILLVLSLLLRFAPAEMSPFVAPAHNYNIDFPAELNIELPSPLYISNLLPVGDEDGLLMVGSSWSREAMLDRQVMIRLSQGDSLRWHYATEISSVNRYWNFPVSLGEERFAIVQETTERADLLSYDILIIEDGFLIKEIPLGEYSDRDFFFELYAAPNGFYLYQSPFSPYAAQPDVVTFYDTQGNERFTMECPHNLYILSVLGLEDGALLLASDHAVWPVRAGCIRLDSNGEIVWKQFADNTNVRYHDAVLTENGDFLVIGERNDHTTAFLLDKDGQTFSERLLVETPSDYGSFATYGETVATPEGYAIRQSVYNGLETQRVILIDGEGNPLGYKHFAEEDGFDQFLTFLFVRDETLCIGSYDYIWKDHRPLQMVPVAWESVEQTQN